MEFIYKQWSRGYKEILDFEGDENCEKLHNGRQLYFVVAICDDAVPRLFLEIKDTFLLAGFIDGLKRVYLNYIFEEIETGIIFLRKAHYWDYEGATDKKIFSTEYVFATDGYFRIIKTDLNSRESEIVDSKNPVDISGNYDTYPEFGKYENIIKFERFPPL